MKYYDSSMVTYLYIFIKSIRLENGIDFLQFGVVWSDTSRLYIHVSICSLNDRYDEKGRKVLYKEELKENLKNTTKVYENKCSSWWNLAICIVSKEIRRKKFDGPICDLLNLRPLSNILSDFKNQVKKSFKSDNFNRFLIQFQKVKHRFLRKDSIKQTENLGVCSTLRALISLIINVEIENFWGSDPCRNHLPQVYWYLYIRKFFTFSCGIMRLVSFLSIISTADLYHVLR